MSLLSAGTGGMIPTKRGLKTLSGAWMARDSLTRTHQY